jgi:hypothetical protein
LRDAREVCEDRDMSPGELQMEEPAPQRRAPARKRSVAATPAPGSTVGVGSEFAPLAVRPRAADALAGQLQRAVAGRAAASAALDPLPAGPRMPLVGAAQAAPGSLQRVFSHKGRKQKAASFGKDDAMPTIQGASKGDLLKLATDEHDYGQLENKAEVAEAMTEYARRHPVVAEKTPLDESQVGNVTVLEVPAFRRNLRATFQLDWLQGKQISRSCERTIPRNPAAPTARRCGAAWSSTQPWREACRPPWRRSASRTSWQSQRRSASISR